MKRFTAENFDADCMARLAREAGMRYINFTPYHGGGPYMFKSSVAHPNTADDLPAKCDLVKEVAEACRKYSLKIMLYIHPSISQSHEKSYARNMKILRELLTNYGPIAGLWFDSDRALHRNKERYPRLAKMYSLVRSLQPKCLISYCYGITGDEDFITFEHRYRDHSASPFLADEVKRRMADKPVEICTTLQLNEKGGEGIRMWFDVKDGYHRNADEVWQLLELTAQKNCNLLLNTGLKGDGSIPDEDVKTLVAVGKRLRKDGFPTRDWN